MVERTVTIRVGVDGAAQLLDVKKQLDAIKANSRIRLNISAGGLEQAQKNLARTRAESRGIIKDLDALGGALSDKAIKPLAQYQNLMGSALQVTKLLGTGSVSALQRVSLEFQRQRTLAQFWGTSGYMAQGIHAFKGGLGEFVAGSGLRFTKWLQDSSSGLAQYRTALAGAAAVMLGFAAAAGLSSKHAQNYIKSTLDSRLMARKLTDRAGAEAWVQGAQTTDWSAGRESRMGVFQTVLSKNPQIGQKFAQKATEDIEKFFFANQEMLQKKGFASAEQLASAISAPVLSGEDATKFEDIFGLGFSRMTSTARLGRLSTEAPNDEELQKALGMRPDEILTKRLNATTAAVGDSVIPVLNRVLGLFLDISDAIGKIPGLGNMIAWGAVLTGAGAGGLILLSVIGSLIPGLMTTIGLFSGLSLATRAAAAAQWLLNVAMTANPLGIAILGIAALVAGLYLLEKKFGVVTKAYQAFAGTDAGKRFLGWIDEGKKALTDLLTGKGSGKAVKFGLDLLGNASPMMKVQLMLFDYLRKIFVNSGTLNKYISTGMGYWAKIVDFFGWLIRMVESGLKWIRDGLGITKEEAKEKYGKLSNQLGYRYSDDKKSWYKGYARVSEDEVPGGVKRAYAEYLDAPGNFLSGVPEAIKSALSNWDPKVEVPGLKELAEAIANLQAWLDEHGMGGVAASTGAAASTVATDSVGSALLGPVYYPAKATYKYVTSLDAGGPVIGSGGSIVHEEEEVDPARVVRGGKTTLARINDLMGGARASPGQTIVNVNLHQENNINGVSSDIDINRLVTRISDEGANKLIFALREKLDNTSNRGIAYMRG